MIVIPIHSRLQIFMIPILIPAASDSDSDSNSSFHKPMILIPNLASCDANLIPTNQAFIGQFVKIFSALLQKIKEQ